VEVVLPVVEVEVLPQMLLYLLHYLPQMKLLNLLRLKLLNLPH
jgi:hypothetical protein